MQGERPKPREGALLAVTCLRKTTLSGTPEKGCDEFYFVKKIIQKCNSHTKKRRS